MKILQRPGTSFLGPSAMDPYRSKRVEKYKRSGAALSLLVLLGCGIIFFSIALIACSFVINYADDFQVDGDTGLEALVQSQFSYCQYWAGVPVSNDR